LLMMTELISENASICLVFRNSLNKAIIFFNDPRDWGFLSSAMLHGVGRQSVEDVSAQHTGANIQREAAKFQKGANIMYKVVKA